MFNKIKEDTTQIQDLEGLLRHHIRGKIVKHEVRPLTQFGENYGSEMLSVEITAEENGQENVVHAVAKLIPHTEFQQEMFNTQVTFKNEIAFYAEIVPALQAFQRENGFSRVTEFAPKFFGGRISLNPNSQVVDIDGVIVLENLKTSGFSNIDRQKGFDLHGAKAILSYLANFHATSVALRRKKPEVYKSKVEPYMNEWKMLEMPLSFDSVIKENPNISHLISRVQKTLSKKRLKKIREPWVAITHNDLWVNNIMVKDNIDDSDDIRFVDFQIPDVGSPAIDVIFFLFSSVQNSVLHYHLEKLLQFYYKEFIQVLQSLNVDAKEFTYESFQEELKLEGNYQTSHSLLMTFPILGPKEQPKMPGKAPKWNPTGKVGLADNHAGPPPNGFPDGPPPEMPMSFAAKEKIWLIVQEASKRDWI